MLEPVNPLAAFIKDPGLVVTVNSGVVFANQVDNTIPQTAVALTANATNYIYLQTSAPVSIQINTTGFPTTNVFPIAIAVTGNTGLVTLIDSRPDYFLSGGSGSSNTFQVNGTNLTSSSTINFQNAAAFNGLTATFTNPSAGNIQLGFSGTLGNTGLTNSTVTFNGVAVALGASGTLTFANIAAGTNTNALLIGTGGSLGVTGTGTITPSFPILAPNGSSAAPNYSFTNCTTCGPYYSSGAGEMVIAGRLGDSFLASSGGLTLTSTGGIRFTPGSVTSTQDIGIDRQAAGVLEINDGTIGDSNGKIRAAGYISAGTKFTSNGGCTEGTLVGGATAGKFTVGQNTACTVIITMGNTATAPNGWTCTAYDQTAVPAVAIRQTASTTTTCSLLMTVATNDVITFSAIGY